jgi:hypothetical protein
MKAGEIAEPCGGRSTLSGAQHLPERLGEAEARIGGPRLCFA